MLPVTYTLGEPSVSWIDCEYIWLRVHLGDAQEQADLAFGGNSHQNGRDRAAWWEGGWVLRMMPLLHTLVRF